MLSETPSQLPSNPQSAELASIPVINRRSLWMGLLGYAVAIAITMLLILSLYRVTTFDRLNIPFTYGTDGLYYLALVKTIDETGWYYHNERIGQLRGLDYREFPTSDGWAHYLVIIAILKLGFDPFTALNIFYLLTFPLTTISALFVGRRLGLSYAVSLMISILYTFQPYHVARVGHPFLAACYFVPLAILLVIRLYQGRLLIRARAIDGQARWKFFEPSNLGALLVAALIGAGGVYYAFFSCFFFMVAGTARSYAERRWASFFSAGLLSCVVVMTLAVTLGPSLEYRLTHPKNGDAPIRHASDTEILGLKVVQMLMPVSSHRWEPLREFKARYYAAGTPLINENDVSSLGIIGSVGLLYLSVRLLLRRDANHGAILDGLALVTVAGILLACVGGFGAAISWYISPWIRAYNRISIFIAFFALLAIGSLLDRYERRWVRSRWHQALFVSGVIGWTILGYFDETNRAWVPQYGELEYEVGIDNRYVAQVEAVAPKGGIVFQLPHGGYPESYLPNGMLAYEMFRPYLHSHHLHWTYGSVTGHYGNEWAKIISHLPTPEFVARLAQAEIAGISIDRNGYQDHGAKIEAELYEILKVEPIVSENQRHVYYDLSAYIKQAKSQFSTKQWANRREHALHPIVPLCRNGFFGDGSVAQDTSTRLCQQTGEIHLDNNLDETRSVHIQFYVSLLTQPSSSAMHIHAPGWEETFEITTAPHLAEHQLSLPPGRTVIRLECDAKPIFVAADPRRGITFHLMQLKCIEEMPSTGHKED